MTNESKIFDSKIIVLYILDIAGKPLSIDQIVKFCEEFDDITYFDICSYIDSLKTSNYIDENLEENTMIYSLNDLGRATLKELLELIPGVNLHNIKKMINKNITKVKTDFSIDTTILPIKDDEYKVSCYIKDGNEHIVFDAIDDNDHFPELVDKRIVKYNYEDKQVKINLMIMV